MVKYRINSRGQALAVSLALKSQQLATFYLISDSHHDSPHSLGDLEKKHLEMARKEGAFILLGGDTMDAMQGRFDKRRSYSALRDDLASAEYFDLLVKRTIERYKPYANNIIGMGMGNHESQVLRNYGTNLTQRVISGLNDYSRHQIAYTGYEKFINLSLFPPHAQKGRTRILMYYTHGNMGGRVTKGAIAVQRRAVYLPDVDIVWSGHTHQQHYAQVKRKRVTMYGRVHEDIQHHIVTSGYHLPTDWATEKGFPPEPYGCARLQVGYLGRDKLIRVDWLTV